jgi:hypothetical protein
MPDASYLEYRLSGGAANTDPDLSLGGVMSSETIKGQSQTGLTMTGVTYVDGSGNPEGVGDLQLRAGPVLRWQPSGDTFLNQPDVSADGRYSLYATSGAAIFVDVVSASLPAPDVDNTLTIANIRNELFDDIASNESWDGMTDYRCFFLTNTHPTDTFNTVKIYIDQQPLGADTLRLGYNSAGLNADAETIVNETTAPSGSVVFGTHTSEGTAIDLSPLAAGDRFAVWVERSISPGTLTGSQRNVFRFRVVGLD